MSDGISSAEKPSLDGLKRGQEARMKHHEALNTVARDWGYLDYRHARAVLAPDEEEEECV